MIAQSVYLIFPTVITGFVPCSRNTARLGSTRRLSNPTSSMDGSGKETVGPMQESAVVQERAPERCVMVAESLRSDAVSNISIWILDITRSCDPFIGSKRCVSPNCLPCEQGGGPAKRPRADESVPSCNDAIGAGQDAAPLVAVSPRTKLETFLYKWAIAAPVTATEAAASERALLREAWRVLRGHAPGVRTWTWGVIEFGTVGHRVHHIVLRACFSIVQAGDEGRRYLLR